MKTYGLNARKDTIFDGKSYSVVQQYATSIPCICTIGEYLQREGITRIAMESTGTYWVPMFECLCG